MRKSGEDVMYKKHIFINTFKMSYLYKDAIKAKPSEIHQKPHFSFLLPVLDHRKSNTSGKMVPLCIF